MPIIQIIYIFYKTGILLLLVGNVPGTYHIKLNEIERGKRVIFIRNMLIADRKKWKNCNDFFGGGDVTISGYLPPSLVTVCHYIGLPPSLPTPVTSFLNGP